MEKWAQRHSTAQDVLVLEASGNAFAVAARLRALPRQVAILDSHQAGKVGKVYCANDRVDAVKIGRIYLSGLAALVWQPDPKTCERGEVFSAYFGSRQRVDPAQTTTQSDAQRTLCAFAQRLPLDSSHGVTAAG